LLLVCVEVLHEMTTLVARWLACAGSVIHDEMMRIDCLQVSALERKLHDADVAAGDASQREMQLREYVATLEDRMARLHGDGAAAADSSTELTRLHKQVRTAGVVGCFWHCFC
jgi:hypothetical protein